MKYKKLMLFAFVITGLLVLTSCTTKPTETDTMMPVPADDADTEEMAVTEDDIMEDKTLLLYTLDGMEVDVLDGQKVYIKAWASWCSICLSGLQELDDLAATDTEFKVISVVAPDVMGEMSEEDFVSWWKSLDYDNMEVLIDRGGAFFAEAGIRAFPTSIYIGSNGEYADTIIGHNSNELIHATMGKIS